MPLLVRRTLEVPPDQGDGGTPTTPEPTRLINLTWTSPNGESLGLMMEGNGAGVHVLSGIDGLGAAPRAVTTQPLATGGSALRWSHVDQRMITLPLHIQAPTNPELVELKRRVISAFLATTPAAGVPTPGTLRVTRSDGTWREIGAVYMDGLGGADETSLSPYVDRAVLQLLCPDPWFYGASSVAADFTTSTTLRNYLNPYETLSTGRTLGEVTVSVTSDVAVSPVWEVTGPATTVTVRYASGGPGWTYGAISAGRTITVDVERYTVTDETGANRISGIGWPTSTLFRLNPGPNALLISITGGVDGTSSVRLSYRPRWESA